LVMGFEFKSLSLLKGNVKGTKTGVGCLRAFVPKMKLHEKSIGNTLIKLSERKEEKEDNEEYFVEDVHTSPDFKLNKCKFLRCRFLSMLEARYQNTERNSYLYNMNSRQQRRPIL
jgi:hypothetical protein